MIDLTVNQGNLKRTIQRARDNKIVIPLSHKCATRT
jgi:hypothetical protein